MEIDMEIMAPCDTPPALFKVEVCWPEDGEIMCRKIAVVARTCDEAAQTALACTKRREAEVVDVQRQRRRPAPLEGGATRMGVRS